MVDTDIISILQIRKTEGDQSSQFAWAERLHLGLFLLKPRQPQANKKDWSPYQDHLPHITQAKA